ncbi:MAG TPA: hypothetical protein VMW69_13675 [Spirochaetia bacterium]|nr:hypothetical protein [Spirochaetia bacterium]
MPTAADYREVAKLMVKYNGNRAAAAHELGWSVVQLKHYIVGNPDLKKIWQDPIAPLNGTAGRSREYVDKAKRAAEEMDFEDPPPSDEELEAQRRLEAVEGEEKLVVAGDWQHLGITDPKQIEMLSGFETFLGKKITSILDFIYGGMVFTFTRGAVFLKEVSTELEGMEKLRSDDPKKKAAHNRFMDLAKLMKSISTEAHQAAYTRLLAQQKAGEMDRKKGSRGKPGFSQAKPASQ